MGKCNSHCAYIRAGQSSENKTKSITKHIQSNEGCVCKSYFAETWVERERRVEVVGEEGDAIKVLGPN